MNDRSRAIDILRRARDLLAERLTERILESRDEILADAMGLSYQSEIDAIYEQLGARLNHVSSMLGSLPPETELAPDETPTAGQGSAGEAPAGPPALPSPRPIAGYLAGRETSSFRTFGLQVQAGDIGGVGGSLAFLFGLPAERGQRCAEFFFRRMREERTVSMKVQLLRHELQSGNHRAVQQLLSDCFGLQELESIDVIRALRGHLKTVAGGE